MTVNRKRPVTAVVTVNRKRPDTAVATIMTLMAWCCQATSHYLSQCGSMFHIALLCHSEQAD